MSNCVIYHQFLALVLKHEKDDKPSLTSFLTLAKQHNDDEQHNCIACCHFFLLGKDHTWQQIVVLFVFIFCHLFQIMKRMTNPTCRPLSHQQKQHDDDK
jgi:hypothetical protein